MKNKKSIIIIVVFLLLSTISIKSAFALAYDNSGVGLKGFTMGSAFVGIADDASAVYYNPAGLAFIEKDTRLMETYSYLTWTDFEHTANSVKNESDEVAFLPGFFICQTYQQWALAYGFYIPYAGGGGTYSNFNNQGYDYASAAGLMASTLSVAYRLSDELSFGAGLSVYTGMFASRTKAGAVIRDSEYAGAPAGYGANVGFMYKPTEKLSIGLSIKSEVPVKMDGEIEILGTATDSKLEYTLPYYYSLGLGYKLNSKLTLAISYCYMLWSDMDKMSFTTLGVRTDVATNYRNSSISGFGIEYRIADNLAVRGGLKFTQGSVKDVGMNAAACDIDLLTSSLGLAYNINESTEVNASIFRVDGFKQSYNSQTFDQDHFIFMAGVRLKR